MLYFPNPATKHREFFVAQHALASPPPVQILQAQDAVRLGLQQNALGHAAAYRQQTESAADIVG